MAKSKFLKFTGVASYAMLYSPDEYNDKRFWKINLHPSEETFKKLKDAGIQSRKKPDEGKIPNASGPYVSFKRYTEKEFADGTTYFAPPQVLNKDGKKLVYYTTDNKVVQSYTEGDRPERVGDPILIGNGSEVEVTLEVYPTKRFGNGTRLVSVRIIDLVEYNPDGDSDSVGSDNSDSGGESVKVEQEEVKEEAPKVETKKKAKLDW